MKPLVDIPERRTCSKATPDWVWALVGLVLALLVIVISFPLFAQAKWPPGPDDHGLLTIVVATPTAVFFFGSSRCRIGGRIFYGVCILLTLLAVAAMWEQHLWTYRDYPWITAIPILLGVLIGAWFAKQRWLLIFVPIAVATWFAIVLATPLQSAPLTQTMDGVTVSLQGVSPRICLFSVKAPDYELPSHIDVEASLGMGIPIHNWVSHRWPGRNTYSAEFFAPDWSKSINVRVKVPLLVADKTKSPQPSQVVFQMNRVRVDPGLDLDKWNGIAKS